MFRNLLLPMAVTAAFVSSLKAAAQSVEWSNASAAGDGCPIGTSIVTITPGGDEIAWTFDSFGFQLQGTKTTASQFCRLTASAKVKRGLYLGHLIQELTFGATKSKIGSVLTVGAQSRFFSRNMPALGQTYADGVEVDSPLESISSEVDYLPDVSTDYFCRSPSPVGLFQSTLSAVGKISGRGTASISVQGQNVTFRAVTDWMACPNT